MRKNQQPKKGNTMKATKLTVLFVCAGCLAFHAQAQEWTLTSAPNQHWQSIASSADGTKLVAVADQNNGNIGAIYTSTNSGSTWVMTKAPNLDWNWVASSADGNYLAATTYGQGIYTSTNAGTTWVTTTESPNSCWSIASSTDGSHLVAGTSSGNLYLSTNAGGTWSSLTNLSPQGWTSVACSENGINLVAGAESDRNIYISTNSGITWRIATNVFANPAEWVSVASSADGTRLMASAQTTNPLIYVSDDAGLTWTTKDSPHITGGGEPYVASSADGSHLAAAVAGVGVYTSTDSGVTWTTTGSTPSGTVALSANGAELIASVYGGGIWTMALQPCMPYDATATATVSDGFVIDATITDSGCGYTNTPLVLIEDGGGTGATATAVVSNGGVVSIKIEDAGNGYTSTPNMYIFFPISITAQPQSVTVNAGDTASFGVTASGGTAPLSYQWSINGTNIPEATSDSLTILNVAQTNLGTYAVIVEDVFGPITSSNATLSMYPFINTPFTGLLADWGTNVMLSVGAWGTGPLSYQWFDNGVAVLGATNQILDLTSIQFSNAGLYSVVISNQFGSVTNEVLPIV
jgi:hypothetical protein